MSRTVDIRGDSRIIGLLGYPVAHSLSPQIHNHAFATLGLPFVYVPLPVIPANFTQVVGALRSIGAVGANVTLPHKLAAASLCDSLSPLSQKLGTVNTLYFRDNALVGTTTDPEGFLRALARMGHDVHGGTMVILGNGGTARTLAAALALEHIPKKITLAGRSTERVSALAAEISSVSGSKIHSVGLAGPALRDAIDECTLLVNCTSAGMYPNVNETPLDKSFLHAGLTVFDTVYNPEKTRLLREAEAAGCKVQNGLRMLLYQAIASLTLWTGVDILEDIFDLDELQKSLLK